MPLFLVLKSAQSAPSLGSFISRFYFPKKFRKIALEALRVDQTLILKRQIIQRSKPVLVILLPVIYDKKNLQTLHCLSSSGQRVTIQKKLLRAFFLEFFSLSDNVFGF